MDVPVAALRFLDLVDRDLAGAGLRPLEEYLALFPGDEDVVRDEYARLRVPDAATEPEAPRLLGGRYEVVESLGRGAFGEVFLAVDRQLDRRVAVKVMAGLSALSREWRARLVREATATNRIASDGVCPVHDVGFEAGVPFLVMPRITGQSLDRLIAASAARGEGPVKVTDAVPAGLRPRRDAWLGVVEQLARTLHAAHQAGVVHRDVKPANVLVRSDGRPVLIDFGLAWLQSDDGGLSRSSALGTPAYSAPEALHGLRPEPDPRLDVWGLGVVLFEGLTLRRPFVAQAGRSLERAVMEDPMPQLDPALGRDLQAVVETALARDPASRYPDMQAFADDLRRLQDGEPVTVRAASRLQRFVARVRSRPMVAGVAVAVAGFIVSMAILATSWVYQRRQVEVVGRAAGALAASFDEFVRQTNDLARYGRAIADRAVAAGGALSTVRELREGVGRNPGVDRSFARILITAASLELQVGQRAEGVVHLREAIAILERLAEDGDLGPEGLGMLSHALVLRGDALNHAGRRREALRFFEEAFELDRRLLEAEPRSPRRWSDVGFGHLRIGRALRLGDEHEQGEEHFRAAAEHLERAAALDPGSADREAHALDAWLELATPFGDQAPPPEQARILDRVRVRLEPLLEQYPDDARLVGRMMRVVGLQAPAACRDGRPDCLEQVREWIRLTSRIIALEPGTPAPLVGRASALKFFALELLDRGDLDGARAQIARCREDLREALALAPYRIDALRNMVQTCRVAVAIERLRADDEAWSAACDACLRAAEDLCSFDGIGPEDCSLAVAALLDEPLGDRRDPQRALELLEAWEGAHDGLTPRLRDLERTARAALR